MRKFAVVVLALLALPVLSQAQSNSYNQKAQVYAGYTFTRDYGMVNPYNLDSNGNGDFFGPYNRNGAQVEASYFPTTHFGLTYEMGFFSTGDRSFAVGNPGETVKISTQRYLIGPAFRYTPHDGASRLTFFAHQLFGSSHNKLSDNQISETNFDNYSTTLVSGAGVDFRLSHHFSVCPVEMEYQAEQMGTNFFGGIFGADSSQSAKFGVDGFSYTGGVVFNF